MATIINREDVDIHAVSQYNFKVLGVGSKNSQTEEKKFTKDSNPKARESDIDSSAMSQNSKDSLIESLMKKTDEMSSNFIKLQMKLESKEEEYQNSLEEVKKLSYDEGVKAGKIQAKEDTQASYENGLTQISASIATLESSAKDFEVALEGIKSELISAALDISKEVISVELKENSLEVAKVLGSELMKELQSASKVTLKVNPKDHGALSESLGSLEHIEIISDSAISEGGVIAMSDAGNIDAQISKRFDRVKKAALSE
ncbi:MAG: flagellar assembly protein FliH [Sulfurimonas sp.]|nr:flagellar assembly protein FliH [Sulfurimonas sp.]